jgi:predicted phage terminase large subunit-like protein
MTLMSVAFSEYDLVADVCKGCYLDFLREMWETVSPEPLKINWHMEYLCEELQIVAERVFRGLPKLYDLVINISPGTTKSSAASVFFTPWLWANMPHCRSINGSHTQDLVLDLARKSRDVILSEKYRACFPFIQLRDDQNTKGYFANTKGGTRFSCTVGGKTPTGMHGHIHIVDDPIDPAKALSDLETNSANSWLDETLSTRKVDKAITPLILIAQRLSQNDPPGYLLSKRGRKIKHICIPAEVTEKVNPPELKKFYIGGLMDPERLPRDVLEEFKLNGDYFYAGQFLQDPVPPGGGMFKTDRLKLEKGAPDFSSFRKLVRYWDKAGSTKKGAAWTVGTLMGVTKDIIPQYWILDVDRFREESAARERKIKEHAHKDGHEVWVGIEQEGGSGGKESAEATIARLGGYRCKIIQPRGDKEWRADPFSTQVNAGNVHILEAPWNKEYIDEMKHFPHSRFKDQIDSSAGAFSLIFQLRRRVGSF